MPGNDYTDELSAGCFSRNVDRYKVCNIEQQLTSLLCSIVRCAFQPEVSKAGVRLTERRRK